jgi:hypothetical protein
MVSLKLHLGTLDAGSKVRWVHTISSETNHINFLTPSIVQGDFMTVMRDNATARNAYPSNLLPIHLAETDNAS